jgi:CMP-N-acetylneuraminic acid synthetase
MSLVSIIPALEKNRYSKDGDLSSWGETNLLEWKISQLKLVNEVDRIIVSTDSEKISEMAHKADVEVFKRDAAMSLSESLVYVCSRLSPNDDVLWVNPTSPFLSPTTLSLLINEYFLHDKPNDGIVTSKKMHEYFFDENSPINFNDNAPTISREGLSAVYTLTNAAYLANCRSVKARGRMFGQRPIFFETSWLASLEVRKSQDIDMFSSLISKYFQEDV